MSAPDGMFDFQARVLATAAPRRFERLAVAVSHSRTYGIRVADSAVCRENTDRSQVSLELTGDRDTRSATVSRGSLDPDTAAEALRDLDVTLAGLPADPEYVAPVTPGGTISWDPTAAAFDEAYVPVSLYRAIAAAADQVRRRGLRLTAFLEARQLWQATVTSGGLSLATHDHGLTVQATVDDPRHPSGGGRSGAAAGAAVRVTADTATALVGSVVDRALTIATTLPGAPEAIAPGDHTVVLSPQAVADLLSIICAYGLFDRRKADEGRSYLSRHAPALRFPPGMRLERTLALPLADGGCYGDLPLSGSLEPRPGMTLIAGQGLRDLHTSPYWAKKTNHAATYDNMDAPPLHLGCDPGSPLAAGSRTVEELIGSTSHGIYVTNLWYLRMVSEMEGVLTGMTRDGLFEIRDGRLTRPLRHMRWHDNPFRILGAVTAMTPGGSLFGRGRLAGSGRMPLILAPALKVENFHFSSVTEF